MRHKQKDRSASAPEGRVLRRCGMTLVEVVVALSILGGVLIALGLFSARLSQETTLSRVRIEGAQLAADRLEEVKGAPRYADIESLYVATESTIVNHPGYRRQTWVQQIGGGAADTIDYKIVTVQVTHRELSGSIRKTTTIAPY